MGNNICRNLRPLRYALIGLLVSEGLLILFGLKLGVSLKTLMLLSYGGIVVFCVLCFCKIQNPMKGCRQELQEKQYASDVLYRQAELNALQSQINPHFLYNTLDSIRGQAVVEGAEDIAAMTEALSSFFRYSISNKSNVATLNEELENIQNYFSIQQFRFNNRFRLNILPFSEHIGETCSLPKMTLQPILENTILHGMEGKIGSGTITIRVEDACSHIIIVVSDDGTGMSDETLRCLQAKLQGEVPASLERTHGNGIALPNVNRRIKLLFGEQYGLHVMSTLGLGTDVEIVLPYNGDNL